MDPPPSTHQVFHEHARYVLRVLRYLGVREADVQDVCQDVFITVHRKLGEFEGRASIRTWLYRICCHAASDHRRRASVRREVASDGIVAEADRRSHRDAAGEMEARASLQYALSRLDDAKREVFVLYEVEGLSMREVCEVVDCPLQTAYSRLHAARKVVSDALAREAEAGEP